jgi:putative ABC transport system substrate-binding protein
VYRIGFVSHPLPVSPEPATLHAFRQGLRELGYVEGKNVILEPRSTGGRQERLPELFAELIRLRVDALVVGGTAPTLAAKKATTIVPIVFASVIDPVAPGIVASLARPGGNIPGITFWVGGAGFAGKWVELLKEAAPHVSHVAVLHNRRIRKARRKCRKSRGGTDTEGEG